MKCIVHAWLVVCLAVHFSCLRAQIISPDDFSGRLSEFFEGENADQLLLYDYLLELRQTPLDLNNMSASDLADLHLLSDLQIDNIIRYRETMGDFLDIHELQAVPKLSLKLLLLLKEVVTTKSNRESGSYTLKNMLLNGTTNIYIKGRTIIEKQAGYVRETDSAPIYAGDKQSYVFKIKHQFGNSLKMGLNAEKDPGESFFRENNKFGFDYYSFYFSLQKYSNWLPALIIGDYAINLGQGLISYKNYGSGKSGQVMSFVRGGKVILPHSSINESLFYRGMATTLRYKNIDLSLFVSRKKIDTAQKSDTLHSDNSAIYISSIIESGLHRTSTEIANKKNTLQNTVGARMQLNFSNLKIGLNQFWEKLEYPKRNIDRLYKLYSWEGKVLLLSGVDYSLRLKNLHLSGEMSVSEKRSIAQLHNLQISLSRKVDFGLSVRNYPIRYSSYRGKSFGETSGINNESGIYAAMIIRFAKNWELDTYMDIWKHSWLKSGIDAPSNGYEYYIKLQYQKRHKLTCYVLLKHEMKLKNADINTKMLHGINLYKHYRLRLHISFKINKKLELRNRIELSRYGSSKSETGIFIYQDILFKPLEFPLSFTARYAIFDVESYDARIYAYENDLLYSFQIPAFYKKGTRFYLNLRYKINYHFTFEIRFSQSYYPLEKTVSSANELINSKHKTELKAQLKIKL